MKTCVHTTAMEVNVQLGDTDNRIIDGIVLYVKASQLTKYRINIGPNHRSINLASCLGWWKFRLATYKTSKSTGLLVWLFVMSQNHQCDQIIDVVNKQVWLCAIGEHWYNRSHLHWTSARGDHVSGRMGGRSYPHHHSMPQWLFWQNPHILMLTVVVMSIS